MLDVGGHTVVMLALVYSAIERSEAIRMITMGLLSAQILLTGISSSTESPRSQNRFFGVWGLTSPAYPDTRLSGLYGVDRAHIAPLSSIFKNNGRFYISCNGSHVWINIEIGDVLSSGEDQAAVRADLNGVLLTAAPQDEKSTSDVRAFVEKDLIKAPVRRDLLDMLTVSDPVTLVIAPPVRWPPTSSRPLALGTRSQRWNVVADTSTTSEAKRNAAPSSLIQHQPCPKRRRGLGRSRSDPT